MSYRLRDIVLAILLLAALCWLFLLIMLLLFCTQQRVFFWQTRTGMGENPFRMVKFSTLRDILPGEREYDDARHRLTPVGRWLRRFSLDELPQVWNVLRGEMSFVGPRPLLHHYLPLYPDWARRRFAVRPGITGLAQVEGRNLLSFTERFRLDVQYVNTRSWGRDLLLLLRTPLAALRGGGVYGQNGGTVEAYNGEN